MLFEYIPLGKRLLACLPSENIYALKLYVCGGHWWLNCDGVSGLYGLAFLVSLLHETTEPIYTLQMPKRVVPKILNEAGGAGEEKGEHARMSAFIGAIAIADLVKTTLGPKGMDKILQSMGERDKKKVTFTNDGATILRAIPIDNAAAKILVDTSKTQDAEVGDGTTSVAVLSGEFLREAEKLVSSKIHPQTIIRGWRKAIVCARSALEEAAVDNGSDPEKFRADLINIARTTLSSKILSQSKDHFAELATSAVLRLGTSTDLQNIQVIKKVGGKMEDSYLDDGFILDKKIGVGQAKRVENAKVMIANTTLDTDKIKIHGACICVLCCSSSLCSAHECDLVFCLH